MKYLFFLIIYFLLAGCTNDKGVYWCGDHACINNKEKEAYFKKTMIVEIRKLSAQDKKNKSELEIIKERAGLEDKNRVQNEKELTKQARLEEKRKIKEEKELTKQARLEEKKIIKDKKKSSKKKTLKEEKVILDVGVATININKFKELVENIYKKNMFRSYPDINDIPN